MSPIKKRRRYEEQEKADKLAAKESKISLETIEETFAAVIDSKKQPPPHDVWLQLALLQNRLLHQISMQEEEMTRLREAEGKKQKDQQAVAYETQVLERQIDDCKRHPIPFLTQLAREETGKAQQQQQHQQNEDDDVVMNDGDDPSTLREFLQVDHMNPKEKPKILATLQTCFEQRAALGKTVQAKKQELQTVEAKVKNDQDFLKQLPTYLQTMERSSNSFAKFMEKHNMVHPLAGTSQRMKRLKHAKQLSDSLYTLFSMIQRCIDSNSSKEEVGKLGLANNNSQVTLQIPIPNVVAAGPKKNRFVTLTFTYHSATAGAVGAIEVRSNGDAFAIHDESLLAELFPGDTSDNGRFGWAQHLAGLYPATTVTVSSTRWILQHVRQRIRSNAILHHCLHSLERRHLPVLPNGNGDDPKPQTQIALFQRDTTSSSDDVDFASPASSWIYNLTIRHPTSGRELTGISVTLYRPRYPAIAPVWTIADPALAELEERLHATRKRDYNDDTESSSFDWMFMQQLHVLLLAWDAMEETTGRTVRGRDRKAIL